MAEIDVVLTTLPGPFGPYHLAVDQRGVLAAAWDIDAEGFERSLTGRLGAPLRENASARDQLERILPKVERIVAGDPADVREVPIDLVDRPSFDQQVLLAVREVGWGRVASYGEIARRIGSPRAARAVGGAVGRNPIALLIPCHRVIAADGTLGGYGGDGMVERDQALERKRDLLLREGLHIQARRG